MQLTKSYLMLLCFSTSLSCHAGVPTTFYKNMYVGALAGYGSTTWQGLVPSSGNQNLALSMSTPLQVSEGGAVWGFLAGYEISQYFALEANYTKYPDARVAFDPVTSLFSFDHAGQTEFITNTEMYSLMGKVMLVVPDTKVRVFSSAGVATVHREDMIVNDSLVSPTFGVGVNYPINEHFMAELAGTYTTGFGESQLNPADSYIPFLYSVSFRLAYHF